jgi:hypothetical protein
MASICKVYKTRSSFLRRLAGLATGGADSTHSAFLHIELHDQPPHRSPGGKSFSLSVYKHCKNRLGKSPGCPDLIVSESRCNRFEISLFRSGDSEVLVQIVQAVGRLPRLTSVYFTFYDYRRSDSSESLSLKFDHEAECVIDRLLPVLRESLCSQGASSQLNRFQLDIKSYLRRLPAYEFLTLPGAIPSLESLEILEIPSRHHVAGLKIPAPEDDARRIASALRTSKSLKFLRFSLQIQTWAEVLPALEIIAEPLMFTKIGDASGCARHKHLDGDLVLQELWLDLVLAGVPCIAHEAVKVLATVLDIAGLGFAVRKFSVSLYPSDRAFELVTRIEHGAFVELHVPTCDGAGAAVVEEALRLNRGPSVLSLRTLRPPLVRTILSPLTRDQNGLQANTCVSTLKLLNFNYDSTVELQEGRLEDFANMMKSNSTLEHLEVINWFPTSSYPQCSRDSPVVTRLQNQLRPGGNLRSFTFYGQEMAGITPSSSPS